TQWLVFSPDGTRLAGGDGYSARVWDVRDGKEVCKLVKEKHRISDGAFSADGKQLVTVGSDPSFEEGGLVTAWAAAEAPLRQAGGVQPRRAAAGLGGEGGPRRPRLGRGPGAGPGDRHGDGRAPGARRPGGGRGVEPRRPAAGHGGRRRRAAVGRPLRRGGACP